MNDPEPRIEIRRILVAMDASPSSLAALSAAVDLAQRLGAELLGIFVEDVNLIRLAGLPFVREARGFSTGARPVDLDIMERALRLRARRAKRALARIAGLYQVRWEFRIARGEINLEILQAADEADVIFVGKTGWSGSPEVGSTARAILMEAPQPALMLDERVPLGPVLVAYDGSGQARKALAAARPLVQALETILTLLIVADNEADARALQSEAQQQVLEGGMFARYRWLIRGDAARLTDLIESEMSCVFVVPGESRLPGGNRLIELLNNLDCPVLVVH